MAELAFRMQMRGWHPEIISPCGASPRCSRSRQFQTPPAPPCCARRVKAACQGYGCFQLVRQQCRQLCNASEGSRWRRRSRPGQVTRESAQSPVAQLASGETRYCCRQRKGNGQMRSIAVPGGPQRDAHCRCVTAPPYHHRCRNRLTGRGARRQASDLRIAGLT